MAIANLGGNLVVLMSCRSVRARVVSVRGAGCESLYDGEGKKSYMNEALAIERMRQEREEVAAAELCSTCRLRFVSQCRIRLDSLHRQFAQNTIE